ncbi:hypothetical protein Nepgr_026659 [Nepenthes gracilis]|uniref:Uncharacterized protein n=1 Tax=Nepenthes gracilis TaxID=150966 RepID=A0AAD3TA57_NEPGR|nr:hypothetical protein Nepgr_026659 [Nepenthes gracilis]
MWLWSLFVRMKWNCPLSGGLGPLLWNGLLNPFVVARSHGFGDGDAYVAILCYGSRCHNWIAKAKVSALGEIAVPPEMWADDESNALMGAGGRGLASYAGDKGFVLTVLWI